MHKIYKSGEEFLLENRQILDSNAMATVFMEGNARLIKPDSKENFALRVDSNGKNIIAVGLCGVPFRIFGDVALASELAQVVAENGFTFDGVLGYPEVCNEFLAQYEKLRGGSHCVKHAMDIMFCEKVHAVSGEGVRFAKMEDVPQLAKLVGQFMLEALGDQPDEDWARKRAEEGICHVVVCELDGQIVSIARRTEESNCLGRISWVYTVPQFRGRGLSKSVVSYLTQAVVDSGRIPYLFVDKTNPISNHLYQAIGYEYAMPLFEISYNSENK